MSQDDRTPLTPLGELASGEDAAARSGELLRRVGEVAPFGPARAQQALARIRRRVERPARRSRWAVALVPALGAASLLLVLSLRPTPPPSSARTRLLFLEGSAEERDGRVVMRAGRLVVETGGSETHVDVPGPTGARITVSAQSRVEIRIVQSHVRVCAFEGRTRVESYEFGVHELAADQMLSEGGAVVPIAPITEGRTAALPPPVPAAPSIISAPAVALPPSSSILVHRRRTAVAPVGITPPLEEPAAPAPPVSAVPAVQLAPPAPAPSAEAETAAAPAGVTPIQPPALAAAPSSAPRLAPIASAPASPPRPSALALEAASFERAVRALRRDHDPARALWAIEAHLAAFPKGLLHADASVTHVEALLALGRRADAREALDRLSLGGLPRARELSVVRGELRVEAGRFREAERDFASAVDGEDELAERALVGRADCRARRGDDRAARASLEEYLRRFPNGRFASRARTAIAH